MELVICSDLHDELYKNVFDFQKHFGDIANKDRVLIIAGDLFTNTHLCHSDISYFLSRCSKFFKHVIFVLGNHDCRSYNLIGEENTLANELDISFKKEYPKISNVDVLDYDRVLIIDGVEFWGCTFWTKIDNPLTEIHIQSLGDYNEIFYKDNEPLTVYMTNHINALSRKALKEFLNNKSGLPKVVITHFPLIRESAPYISSVFDDYYDNNLEYFLMDNPKPNIIVYGHTHDTYDFDFEGIRIICNPRGYPHNHINFSPKVVSV